MDASEIIAIEQLAALGITQGISLYKKLRAQYPTMRSVSEILAEANATDDRIIAKADQEIAAAKTIVGN